MVFSFHWKHAIGGILAVAFSAAIVGGSILVILEEKKSRKEASPKSEPPAPLQTIQGTAEQTPAGPEQTPAHSVQPLAGPEQEVANSQQPLAGPQQEPAHSEPLAVPEPISAGGEQEPDSSNETPVSTEQIPVSVKETPVSVEETAVSAEETAASVEETAVSVEETAASVEETAASVEQVPAEVYDDEAALQAESLKQVVSASIAHTAPAGLRIIHTLPRTYGELVTAFQNAPPSAVVPADQPLELTSWDPEHCEATLDSPEASSQKCGLRRSVLAVGLNLSAEEQEQLPEAKRGRILKNLRAHYISIQVRMQRDSEYGAPYLHHLPLVTAASFDGPRVTGPAGAAVVASAGEFRTLGVWLAGSRSPVPENLRTLVLVHRRLVPVLGSGDSAELRPDYELVFIHARPTKADGAEPLSLHTFVTSDGRSRLHHLPPATPLRPAACGIRAFVKLDDFRPSNTDPDRLILRDVSITDRGDYPLEDIEFYGSTQGWTGDAWNNLPEMLDAVIDAHVELVGAPAPLGDDGSVTFTNTTVNPGSSEKR